MTQHSFVRLTGFHLTVLPRPPFCITRSDAALHAIDVEHHAPSGRRFARLIPKDGGYESKVDQHTESLYEVLDVATGREAAEWRIETTLYTCIWPSGFAIRSTHFPADPALFDLVGAEGQLIFIQMPERLPDLEDMCGPGQRVARIEKTTQSERIELEYEHEGGRWCQNHEVVAFLKRRVAVTMQSPEAFARGAAAAARRVARSIAPQQGEVC